jgi:two-component system, response regulator YesN
MHSIKELKLTPADLRCIEQAIQYIEKRYTEKISADGLSLEFGMSKPKLQLGFRKKTGFTLYKYIQQVRIIKAKELLIDTNYPVKAIADAAGFPNESHFCKLFKKITTTSPVNFRFQQAV